MHQPSDAPQPKRPQSRLRRWLRNLAVSLLVLLAAGFVFEAIAGAVDMRRYPPPGELIDVGGYRLHLHCEGTGSPTVILESGSGAPSPNWATVRPAIARFTRVCTYDRAGYAWSDPASSPRTGWQVVQDLDTLLTKAGVDGPLVFAAHSLGGLYARMYAIEHPDRVAGMVLLDARPPEMSAFDASQGQTSPISPVQVLVYKFLFRAGVARALIAVVGLEALAGGSLAGFPADQLPVMKAMMLRPQALGAAEAEFREMSGLEQAVMAGGDLGDMPLTVLTHGRNTLPAVEEDAWRQLQEKQAALSTNGELIVAQGSGHNIHIDQPALVIEAIQSVVEAVRK